MAPLERAANAVPEWPPGFLENWRDSINADPQLAARARYLTADVLFGAGSLEILIRIRYGRCEAIELGPHLTRPVVFALRGDLGTWRAFWQPAPSPGFHDVMALVKARAVTLDGDLKIFLAHLLFFKAVLAAPRRLGKALP